MLAPFFSDLILLVCGSKLKRGPLSMNTIFKYFFDKIHHSSFIIQLKRFFPKFKFTFQMRFDDGIIERNFF